MPSGEDVTGLHAFDDLDPVSTVSALSAMPEPELAPQPMQSQLRNPSVGSAPPPQPQRGAPIPAPRYAVPMSAPPPRAGFASRSVPPPPPEHGEDVELFDAEPAEEEDSFEDTRVMSQADFDYSETESRGPTADSDLPPAMSHGMSQGLPPRTGIDDTELLELSATTVATKIEMDWDEEEVETKLREEGDADAEYTSSATNTPSSFPRRFPPVTSTSPFQGNPSPFVPIHSSYPPPSIATPEHDEWEDDEDARTRVMIAPSFPPPPSLPPPMPRVSAYPPPAPVYGERLPTTDAPSQHESWGTSLKNNKLTWIGFAAVGLIATAIGVTALTGAPDAATVTLETKPADAQVTIDGKVLTGQTSPFTLQGLEPATPHTIEVSKDGYTSQKQQFNVAEGEVKPLPGIELAALRVDTGFAIASTPAGANVFVDGNRIGQVTPARVTDLSDGLHVVRLELAGGYQPWETQVALAKGQVIELPNARLVGGGVAQRERVAPAAESRVQTSDRPRESSSKSSSSSSSRRRSSGGSSGSQVASAPSRSVAPAPQPMAGAAAGAGGSGGVLRVNSRPWSQVFVDGRMIGNTPQLNIPLASGKHKVKLVNPQLGMSKNFDIAVQAGKATTKIVDLE